MRERAILEGFFRSSRRFGTRPALEIGGESISYELLRDSAAAVAATLQERGGGEAPGLTAVIARRSLVAYTGMIGTLMSGRAYVPLNVDFPPERTLHMLRVARCRSIVADGALEDFWWPLLGAIETPLLVITPDLDVKHQAPGTEHHTLVGRSDLAKPSDLQDIDQDADAIAYVMFTSGSTGTPKGVAVSDRNVRSLVEALAERYQVEPSDRFSQNFELTFDPSIFDMFVAWECGACVCPPPARGLLPYDEYIRLAALTVWFSVPSTGLLMGKLGMLERGAFPCLRITLFAGEALPARLAKNWARAAPNSLIENLYGPTEATVVCIGYRWDAAISETECENGIVPIGWPLPGMGARIVDDSLEDVPLGAEGELLVWGQQTSRGYWQDPEKTAEKFVFLPGHDEVHYRTGDRVRRRGEEAPLLFLGRRDSQIKVKGYRVELGEVEAVLREETGVLAVAVGWPVTTNGVQAIAAFLESSDGELDLDDLRRRLGQRLPRFMTPRTLLCIPDLPLDANGKIDRHSLLRRLEAEDF